MFPMVTGTRFAVDEALPRQGREVGNRVALGGHERVVALHEQPHRDEEHVRDAVLEAGRDERRDRRDDREDLVGRRPRAVAEPDGEADESVAEDAERDRLDEAEIRLRCRDRQRLHADCAAAELVLLPDEQDHGGRQRADEVPEVHDRPVARDLHRPHSPAGPRHHDQVVAGEELGAGDDDEDQAEREREPTEEAHDAERDVGAARGHRRREDRAERDEGAGEDGERERVRGGHAGLDDAHLLRLACHLERRQRVEPGRCEDLFGHGA